MLQIADNIFIIPSREEMSIRRGLGAPNTVIAKGDKETIVIDPGVWTHQLKHFRKCFKKNLLSLSEIKKIFFTHHHMDHSMLGHYFQKNNNAELFCHEKEKEGLESKSIHHTNLFEGYLFLEKEMTSIPTWFMDLGILYIFGRYKQMKVTSTIMGGDSLDFENPIEVVSLPSHTPGSVGFYFPNSKTIAVGDLIDLESGISLDLNSPISSFKNGIDALRKLKEKEIEILIPGHGPIIQGEEKCVELIDQRLQTSLDLRQKSLLFLEKGELTLRELIRKLFPDSSRIIGYWMWKHVVYCILQSIYLNEGLEVRKKGRKTLLSKSK
jgi:glyoxylase-like metal-dependent hydrolase (beta-lactamase superfamily II)